MIANAIRSFFVLFLTLCTILPINGTASIESTSPMPCGQYSFRCIDAKNFEICPYNEDGSEKREQHTCLDDLVCDEDNPAYCSPAAINFTTKKTRMVASDSQLEEDYGLESLEDSYASYYDDDMPRLERDVQKDSCRCDEETSPEPATTTTEESFTTVLVTIEPPYDCDGYGFFPDEYNETLFWFCDVPQNGQGYLIRHMICGENRIYDRLVKTCVLKGTTRNIRGETKKNLPFSCKHREPGKYPDPVDCQIYHVCLPNMYSPIRELLFACTDGTSYDSVKKKCTTGSYRLPTKPPSKAQAFNCNQPIRFRSVDNCKGYFLCYENNVVRLDCPQHFKFDDKYHECLPEKIAKCKED